MTDPNSEESMSKMISAASSKNEDAPTEISIIGMTQRVCFPTMTHNLVIEPGEINDMIKEMVKKGDKYLGLCLSKDESINIYKAGFKDLHSIGVLVELVRVMPIASSGGCSIVVNVKKRMKIEKRISRKKGVLKAKVSYHDDSKVQSDSKLLSAYASSIIVTIKELLKMSPMFKEELQIFLSHIEFLPMGKLSDFAAALTTATREQLQEVLEAFDIEVRIDLALKLLKNELEVSTLQKKIQAKIEYDVSNFQKEFYLREQLKVIKAELGLEVDGKNLELEKFEERIKDLDVPPDVLEVINEEMEKFQMLETHSSEFAVTRNYLDWLTAMPWGVKADEEIKLAKAKRILEKEHYGLKEVKERILEQISVMKLKAEQEDEEERSTGSIICIVGPPGVGKTSVALSIAHSLGRAYQRIAMGGVRDEAEIRGHRKTYVGALPGRFIKAMKAAKQMNPVVVIDEIDKVVLSSSQGDPASALLEVLDPAQNSTFVDNYLEVPFDLSDVVFVTTANSVETIPPALLDRMEVIKIAGYMIEEKVEIAKKYLIPRALKSNGLKASLLSFQKEALRDLIDGYAREPGVRKAEKLINKIVRKVATEYIEAREAKKTFRKKAMTSKLLKKYLGQPYFTSERIYFGKNVGVVNGMAYTSMGGAILHIECTKKSAEKLSSKLTGQTGDVMRESKEIALTYIFDNLSKFTKDPDLIKKVWEIHVHVPDGATPKDGPSAGIAMATVILSQVLGVAPRFDVAMTGEISLTGKVLPIGGVKEKCLGAKREGFKELIFPFKNMRDWEELPESLKKGMKAYFVKEYKEVFDIMFPKKKKTSGSAKRKKK